MMSWVVPQGFSWSATRGSVFRDCQRAYFFQYYLANNRALGATPAEVAEAARLRQLTAIPLWVGSSVHDAIEGLLRVAVAGRQPDVDSAIEVMVAQMRRDYRASVENHAAQTGDHRRNVRFHEHEHNRRISKEEWMRRVEESKQMVRAWAAHGYWERVQRLGQSAVRALEDLQDWPLDGVKVYVRIDLAYEDEQGVHILDWKTGQREHGRNPLQMMSYALFAMRRWGTPADRLEVMEVYLRLPDPERRCQIDDASLADAEREMRASIEKMLACLDDPRQDAVRHERMPPSPERWKCKSCNFLKLCPEGWEVL